MAKRKRFRLLVFFLAAVLFGETYFFTEKREVLFGEVQLLEQMKGECSGKEIRKLFGEMKKFPVRQKQDVAFENGYGDERSFGGKRKHEGIDILPKEKTDRTFQVVSAADGVVEKLGWLELGGYRVGIRSKGGFYYYYAHLAGYRKGLKEGKKVKAGEVIGNMGNTGYGKEGTKGKFVVHLHFGIYRQKQGEEKSLNPYYLLSMRKK